MGKRTLSLVVVSDICAALLRRLLLRIFPEFGRGAWDSVHALLLAMGADVEQHGGSRSVAGLPAGRMLPAAALWLAYA
jgi:hypothetical protein